ncbi:hypothetical protein ASZ90_003558 [hydrocarbon metagenome]|uniref:Uncharacterized protein n=1 Tax=hydrocarbon metagenome TaxID=938273 RepID=A0A0W8G0P4_9ZZZZ
MYTRGNFSAFNALLASSLPMNLISFNRFKSLTGVEAKVG